MARVSGSAVAIIFVVCLAAAGCRKGDELGTRPLQKPAAPLYQRLGGEKGITKVVDDFVPRVLANRRINFTRQGMARQFVANEENVVRLKKLLVQFLIQKTDGPGVYSGRDMRSVHLNMRISGGEFDLMLRELKASLKQLKVKEQEQKELFRVLETVRKDIVEVP